MKTIKKPQKDSTIIKQSASGKARIAAAAIVLEGKDFFPKKVELAKKRLSNVKSLPI